MSWGSGICEAELASIRMLAYLVLHLRESRCFSIVDRSVFVTMGLVLIGRYSKPAIPPTDGDSTTGRLHYRATRGRATRERATGGLRDLNERSSHLAEPEPELVSSGTDFTASVVTLGISQAILGDAIVIGGKWERVDQGSQLHEPAKGFFEGQLNAC